ncbi:hypothetical protein [Absidia glauca]|uniref:Cyclin-dependent kinase 8 n=1 Tax=Absidia glauca TaxID=4829 RepID=A0A168MA84_ABSGL|nr:hypothetical protein [Absidia glauca]
MIYRDDTREFAIKKFKPDREGDTHHYVGISQSACREIALCRELNHPNVVGLEEVLLEDKAIFMVFEYAEHDFLQIIHHHLHTEHKPIQEVVIKSILWQLINGVAYLHANWVLHRDLKPANVLLTNEGIVKTGDLGLARLFNKPPYPLFNGDKVVVTIWYRAPELLFGARHYTKAVDMWAVGCIFGELLALKPIFKGEEAKMDNKKNVPFQRSQLSKIFEILGTPAKEPKPVMNVLVQQNVEYPLRRITQEDNDIKSTKSAMTKVDHTFILYTIYFLIVTIIAISVILYIYQCDLLYASGFPKGSRTKVSKPSEYGLPDDEEILVTKDGVKLRCYILIQQDERVALQAPTIVCFHGHRLPIAQVLYQKLGYNVVTLSYRGYGLSEGKANEKGLQIDAQTVVDYIKNHPLLKHTQLIAYGQSLGGAVAIYVVSNNEDDFDGLIIENTFLSVPLLIPHILPGALRYLAHVCNQKWRTYKSISNVQRVPILFLSSLRDELVPPSHMAKLYEVAETVGAKVWKGFDYGTHNDTCLQIDYFESIEEFVRDHVLEDEAIDGGAW